MRISVSKRSKCLLLLLLYSQCDTTQGWASHRQQRSHTTTTAVWQVSKKNGRRQSIRSSIAGVFPTATTSKIPTAEQTNKRTTAPTDFQISLMKQENELLRNTLQQLEMENEYLKQHSSKIILESFEGEGVRNSYSQDIWYEPNSVTLPATTLSISTTSDLPVDDSTLWCDELDGQGTCPIEPRVSFRSALKDRALWLVGLLAFQSCSGFILSRNEALLDQHPTIIYFLTMLVGAGGNAGNQASVRVIRGLALGTLKDSTQSQFLWRELNMAAALCIILSTAGCIRAAVFQTPLPETIAVTCALALIVFSSICLGAVLPLLLKKWGVDPAHSSTTIQVVMDILGVVLTVVVSGLVLDSPTGISVVSRLSAALG